MNQGKGSLRALKHIGGIWMSPTIYKKCINCGRKYMLYEIPRKITPEVCEGCLARKQVCVYCKQRFRYKYTLNYHRCKEMEE